MSRQPPSAIGLDIGHRSLKVVRLTRGIKGPSVVSADMLMLPETRAGIEPIVHGFLDSLGLLNRPCAICVSGRSVMLHTLEVPYGNRRAKEAFAGLEVQRLTYLAEDEILSAHSTDPVDAGDDGILVALAPAKVVHEELLLADGIGLDVVRVLPAAAALLRGASGGRSVDGPTIYADIGHLASHVVIGGRSGLVCSRRFEVAGLHFTKAVEAATGLSHAEAEEAKMAHGLPSAGESSGIGMQRTRNAMLDVANRWVDELQTTIAMYRERSKKRDDQPSRIVISGGGAELKGIREHIAEKCRLVVDVPYLPVAARKAPDRPGLYAVACGAAMAALAPVTRGLNLLPRDRQHAIVLRRQRPYWVGAGLAACAAVTVAATGSYLSYLSEKSYHDSLSARAWSMRGLVTEQVKLDAANDRMEERLRLAHRGMHDGMIVRAILAALTEAKHERDWITLVADMQSYQALSEDGKADNGTQPAAGPVAVMDKIVVEGYTPQADFSTVLSMIARLRREPYVAKVDLLTDDRIVDSGDKRKMWSPIGASLFAIEIEVKRE